MRELGPAFRCEAEQQAHGRRALLAPVPGEQHTFGLVMVAEFFCRAGWDVWSGPAAARSDLVGLVRGTWFAVVGLSVAGDGHLDSLASTIRAVRRASRNRGIGVLVGGPAFIDHPELAATVGADATAVDGRQAVLQAQNLLTLLSRGALLSRGG
jgi:methanogenic corrinoid protein MtbC1